jgi:hypothetical protein
MLTVARGSNAAKKIEDLGLLGGDVPAIAEGGQRSHGEERRSSPRRLPGR